jgi:tetratricopeptide (TPR) repeat protein
MKRLAALLTLLFSLLFVNAVGTQEPFEKMYELLNRGYYNSAIQINGPALIRTFPNHSEAHYLFAYALYFANHPLESREELNLATQLKPDSDPRFYHLDGLIAATEGNEEVALTMLRAAFDGAKTYKYAMDWGRIAWESGSYEEALEAYEYAGQTQSGHKEPWPKLNRGRILSYLGRHVEAIQAFHDSIKLFEKNDLGNQRSLLAYVEAYFRLGLTHEILGNISEANAYYQSAHSGDPMYEPALEAINRLNSKSTQP